MNFKWAWLQIRAMKHYFIASSLVFLAGVLLGGLYPGQFHAFIQNQLEALKQISDSVADKPNHTLSLFWLIFWNNTYKSILVMALGIFFGVFPLFFLIANGLILGYLGVVVSQKESWWYVVKTIVPHGVLELPAVVLACAFGLRLGVLVTKVLLSLLGIQAFKQARTQFGDYWRGFIPICIMLIVVLAVAALIESTLTMSLAQK